MVVFFEWFRDSRFHGRSTRGNLAGVKKNGNTPHTLVINADNGPENSGVRSQWLKRLVEFSARWKIKIQLAYYPPYHSKYNPIERVFGVLENYWNGDPLRTTEKALGMAEGMTYNGVHPVAQLVTQEYARSLSDLIISS